MPKLLKTPFAIDAAEGFRTDIQESTGAAPNSATYQVGFPPVTMQSIVSNGMPPKGSDLNGVLYDITDNLVFLTQGGGYGFDSTYATSIGGYPLNARLRLTNGDIVKSTIDGNTNDPNVDMTGWVKTNSASQIFDASGLNQQKINDLYLTPFHFGAIGDGTHHPLSERYATLAEAQVIYPHAEALTDSIDWAALQSFFNYVSANKAVGTSWDGNFNINKPLNFFSRQHEGRSILGRIRLTASQPMSHMLRLAGQYNTYGDFYIRGANLADCGLYLGDTVGAFTSSINNKFGNIYVENCKLVGVYHSNQGLFDSFAIVRAVGCGSRASGVSSDYSNIVQGGTETVNQYSEINCTVLPPIPRKVLISGGTGIQTSFAEIDGTLYQVTAIVEALGTIRVRPRVIGKPATGTLRLHYGSGFTSTGNNSSCISVNNLSVINCGLGVAVSSLYAMHCAMLTLEGCGVGLIAGNAVNDPFSNLVISRGYFEANRFDYVEIGKPFTEKGIVMPSNTGMAASKIVALHENAYVNAAGITYQGDLRCADINIGNETYKTQEADVANTINLTSGRALQRRFANFGTFPLAVNADVLRLTGLNYTRVEFVGIGRNASPTGVITITPPTGYTLNSSASSLVIPAQNLGTVIVTFIVRDQNIFASVQDNLEKIVTTTYDPPSIPSGSSVTTTVTLSGAVVGDFVGATFSVYNAGIEIESIVSAANTVAVKFKNVSAGNVDLGSGTLKVKLI